MKKYLLKVSLITLMLTACSIDVSQPTAIPSPTSITLVATSTFTPPTSRRMVTWAGLNLTGRLVYSRLASRDDVSTLRVETLDLANGDVRTIFTAPEGGLIYYSTVSADGRWLVLCYTPPAQSNPLGNQALYIMPMDGSEQPKLVITPPTEYDQYIQAEWSSDGKYLYYVHISTAERPAEQLFPIHTIFRMAYPDGQPEEVANNAFWPRISADSSKLVYVSLDPATGKNNLFLANADGSNAQEIKLTGPFITDIKDAPIFSPEGQSIIFSAPSPVQSYRPNWFEKLMGIQIVKAHNIPSDWWSVSISGGEPTRLTQIQATNLFGSISPDLKHLASFSFEEGLFVMDLDGSNLTKVTPVSGGSTVNWLP